MTLKNVSQLSAQLDRVGKAIEDSKTPALKAATTVMTVSIVKYRDNAVGSDGRMSHVKNGKLGVKTTVLESSGTVEAIGPWQLIEFDTRAHQETGKLPKIGGRGATRARKQRDLNIAFGATGAFSGVRPLRTPFGPRYRVQHPGTKGKHPFRKGVEAGEPAAIKRFNTTAVDAVRKVFT